MSRKARGGVYFRPGKGGIAEANGKRGRWWITYTIDGKRVREKTNAHTLSEARNIRRHRRTNIEAGRVGLPRKKGTLLLGTLADEYLSWASLNKRSFRGDALYVRRILEHFGTDTAMERITRQDCEEFKAALTETWQKRAWAKAGGKRPEVRLTTVDRHVGFLKRLFNWGIDMDRIVENPAARVKLYRQDSQPFYLLDEAEEDRLLAAARESKAGHLEPVIVLALATAMRRDEILSLTWDQVDLGARRITIPGSGTKNKRIKHVALNGDAVAVLNGLLQSDFPYVFHNASGAKIQSIKTAWAVARHKAAIPEKCRFHDLRHTAVSRMVMRGVDPVTIGRMAGWTDTSAPVMLRRYAHLTEEHLQRAAEVLERHVIRHKLGTNTNIDSIGKSETSNLSTYK